ncbi:hypothetical protein OG705_04540 [Streptomyces sp. NBC_00838]|nr:hypothetical protein OG705_04540 [Streptomyces sp. NBC_00838]
MRSTSSWDHPRGRGDGLNQAAGTLLGQFLTKARLIDGPDDGFLVQIVP